MVKLCSIPQVTVNVLQSHIEDATPRDAHRCMAFRAIQEKHPEFQWIRVDGRTIAFSDPRRRLRFEYITPRIVQQNILRFDNEKLRHLIKPFTFKLLVKNALTPRKMGHNGGVWSSKKRQDVRKGRRLVKSHHAMVMTKTRIAGMCLREPGI